MDNANLTHSAPFEIITPTDQSGIILIVGVLGLIFAFISLLIRLYLQLEIRHQIARDDVAVLLAMLFAVGQSSAVFVAMSKGYGKTLTDVPPGNVASILKASYSSDILYLVTIWLTKCSVAFLTVRLSPDKRHNLASSTVLGAATLFVVISIFLIALGCDLSQPWDFLVNGQSGVNMFIRWQIVAAFDIITELALLAVSIFLVGGLQLSKYKKFVVIFAFALRLPIIFAIAFRLHFLHDELTSPDPTLKAAFAAVCTQVQISYAIIAATTPCLRPFMSALNTNYGAPAHVKTPSSTKKSENSYVLSTLSRNGGQEKGKQIITSSRTVPETRWDGTDHHASVIAADRDNISVDSQSSVQMIIQKNTEYSVEYESRSGKSDRSDRTDRTLV